MNRETERYIDMIIHENAMEDGFSYNLMVNDLTKFEQDGLVTYLLNKDPESREIMLDRVQDLINERIDLLYCEDKYQAGKKPLIDKINGETRWI